MHGSFPSIMPINGQGTVVLGPKHGVLNIFRL
jgi:hypothetical protein